MLRRRKYTAPIEDLLPRYYRNFIFLAKVKQDCKLKTCSLIFEAPVNRFVEDIHEIRTRDRRRRCDGVGYATDSSFSTRLESEGI